MVTNVYGVGGLKLAMNAVRFQGCEARLPLTIPENALEELNVDLDKLRPFLMERKDAHQKNREICQQDLNTGVELARKSMA